MTSETYPELSYHRMKRGNCGEIVGFLHGAIEHEQVHFQQWSFTVDATAFLTTYSKARKEKKPCSLKNAKPSRGWRMRPSTRGI
jgi:hypothetical protein